MSDPTADHVSDLLEEIRDKDRVIARLLDGWQPERTQWVRGGVGNMTRFERYQTEPMSDGEAAIIRAHQASANTSANT
jgi:hypothetical protein